jgi:hypothetical protein
MRRSKGERWIWRKRTMRIRFSTLIALLAMLITLTACSEMAAADAVTADPADITLIPYTNKEFGISDLVPDGWLEVKPGQFLRCQLPSKALES